MAVRAFSFLRDPTQVPLGDTAFFAALAAEAPVLHTGGMWVFSGNSVIREVLASGLLRVPPLDTLGDTEAGRIARSLLPVQPPAAHRRVRSTVTSAFSRRSVDRFRGDLADIVDDLFAGIGDRTELVGGLCRRLPAYSLCSLLGVPRARWDYVFECAEHLNTAITSEIRGLPHDCTEAVVQVHRQLHERLRDPAGILGHPSVLNAYQKGTISHAELTAVAMTMFTGGIDTVGGGIANALLAIDRHPGVRAALVADPGRAEAVFREAVRMHTPLPMIARAVAEPVSLAEGAVALEPGDTVFVVFAAGNLDAAVIEDPLDFDLDRDHRHDLTYGHGAHHCLGSNVADAEGAAVLRYLAEHHPNWRIVDAESVRRADGPAFNSPHELHLELP